MEATAADGDEVARGILREAGGELALAARAVIRSLNLRHISVPGKDTGTLEILHTS